MSPLPRSAARPRAFWRIGCDEHRAGARLLAMADVAVHGEARHHRIRRTGGARGLHVPGPGRGSQVDFRGRLQGRSRALAVDAGASRGTARNLPRLRPLRRHGGDTRRRCIRAAVVPDGGGARRGRGGTSSTISRPNSVRRRRGIEAESYVITVIALTLRSPPPTTPTWSSGTPAFSIRPVRHCRNNSMVGTMTNVLTGTSESAWNATT